jgi:hypothetical protein
MSDVSFHFMSKALESEVHYDLLIAACGYESRCTFIPQTLQSRTKRTVAIAYADNQVHSFDWNRQYFQEVGTIYMPTSSEDFDSAFEEILNPLQEARTAHIAVDVSAFDRGRLAGVIRGLERAAQSQQLDVTFYYAAGAFDLHGSQSDPTVMVNGPLKGFEGWSSDPSIPIACIVGLGFENFLALAALETLEPARTVAFIATSDDARFQQRVKSDNSGLLSTSEVALIPYDLDRPFEALHDLEEVVHALRSRYRVAIVPLGPKLFALMALLVAFDYRDQVTVWRVSGDQGAQTHDQTATGQVTTLRAVVSVAGLRAGHV